MKLLSSADIIEKYKDGTPFYMCYHCSDMNLITCYGKMTINLIVIDNNEARWCGKEFGTSNINSFFTEHDTSERYVCFESVQEMKKYYYHFREKYLQESIDFELSQLNLLNEQMKDLKKNYGS